MKHLLVVTEKIASNTEELQKLIEDLESLLQTQYKSSKEDQDKLKKLEKRYRIRLEQHQRVNSESLNNAYKYIFRKIIAMRNE